MIDRFIFEASRRATAGPGGRSQCVAPEDRDVFEGFGLISWTRVLCRSRSVQEPCDAQQAVAADGEGRHERHARQSAYPHLAQRTPVLAPAKDLFDPLAQPRTGQIAAMGGRGCIDRGAARTGLVLGHVRGYAQLAAVRDEATGVISLV